MPLIDYKSTLSNYRRVIKPKPSENSAQPPVPFGEYTPVTNHLEEYQDDIYGFDTKKLETFDRKQINDLFETDSVLEKNSIYDDVNAEKKDLKKSKVIDNTQEPFENIKTFGNNEESPTNIVPILNKEDKESQAKTILPVSQEDKPSKLVSKYQLINKIEVGDEKKLESIDSKYDIDGPIKPTQTSGRYEKEKESRFGFLSNSKPYVNAFSDKFNVGFKIKDPSGFTQAAFDYSWLGTNENAPSVDFFSNTFVKNGFVKFSKLGQTQYKESLLPSIKQTDSFSNRYNKNFIIKQTKTEFTDLALQYTTVKAVDYFKNDYSENFKINTNPLETAYTETGLTYGLKQLGAVNYFDINKAYTISGFALNQKLYTTDFNDIALDWGLKKDQPATNYFDVNKTFTNSGFTIKQKIYETEFNTLALDYGLQGIFETTNYFDENNNFTDNGFVFKQQLYTTDFNKSALDWGLRGTYPTTDYFDQNKEFTNKGFTFKQQLYATDFNKSALDWGLRGIYPNVNYFDQNYKFTNNGFVINQRILSTDFNSSALDWGLRGSYPTTDYFDQNKQFTDTGFTFKQQLYATDFNPSALDWGLQGSYPTTDYFDQNKQFTNTGFTFKQPILKTDFNVSALDWGLRGSYPTTDYFDQSKQFTDTGFTFKQQLYITDFNSSALDWGLRGSYPTTDYFDQSKQFTDTGFTFKQQLYITDFNSAALDWGLQGSYPTTDYFDQNKQFTKSGFTFKQPLLMTDFNLSALDWGLKGIYPTTDYFDQRKQFTDTGFTFKQQLLITDFNPTALDWGLKGIYPTTNYFDQINQFTDSGFTFKQQIYATDFNSSALDWGLQGSYPTTDYFDQSKQFTNTGFTFKQPLLITDFNSSALDWGLRGAYPTTDYFDQNKQFTDTGFTFKQKLYTTDFNGDALDYSLKNIPPLASGLPSVNLTLVSGKQFAETDYFDIQKINTTRGFHVFAKPLEPTSYKTDSTQYFTVPASDFEIPRIGSPVHNINSQLVKSPIFLNIGFVKENKNTYAELIRSRNYESFLGDVSTKRNSPSLLDIQYEKYSLQDEAINYDVSLFGRQPYITRGIQNKGQIENERWGFGVSFDDGFIRGGAVTAADRAKNDVIRLTKWSTTTKGYLYLVKQTALQLANPQTEAAGLASTRIYQPLSPLLAAAGTAFGIHPPRHGLLPFIVSGKYQDIIKEKTMLFMNSPEASNRNIENASTLYSDGGVPRETGLSNRLKGYYAPALITIGKNTTRSTVPPAGRREIGPLETPSDSSLLKLERLYNILSDHAFRETGLNPFGYYDKKYDEDDNLDINFYIKNRLNPFGKIIPGGDDGYHNISKKVSGDSSPRPEYIYSRNSLREYATTEYAEIPNGYNEKFLDFRYNLQNFLTLNTGTNGEQNVAIDIVGRVNFASNPAIIKYRSNNLEDKAGYGQHGLPGMNRTNPVLSFLCGRVSQGIRKIGGDQYNGEYLFRGDRVNLVDFRHDKSTTDIREIYELGENSLIPGKKDLIEFYVTGTGARDRVIVFRASITEVSDTFNPSWETVKYLNRADPAYIYRGFERDVSIAFDIGITSRDELRTRWRSLNALAGFTAPEYLNSPNPDLDGRMKAPLMKLTLGHLFRSTPCIITNLNYSFDNSQVVWETAKLTRWVNGQEIEETITTDDLDDPACCVALQLPKMIKVTMNLKIIGNYRPQSNGGASGYPDMGVFYQLYANDDAVTDGQLPRKGGIYVNYYNRECTVVNLPPEQPKFREEPQITKEKDVFVKEPQLTKEEIKRNPPATIPDDPPSRGGKDNEIDDTQSIERIQEEVDTGKGEGIQKRQGPSSTKKPRRLNSNGSKSSRDLQPNPSSVNNPRTAAGQAVPYP
jgi:hypothetical protein